MESKFFKNKFFVGSIVLILLLILVDWLVLGRTPQQEIHHVTENVKQFVNKNTNAMATYTASNTVVTQEQVAESKKVVVQFNPQGATETEFNLWFKDEVGLMNQFKVDEDQVSERYRAITAKMNHEQYKILLDKFLDQQAIPNEKILAAYLLAHAGYESVDLLTQAIVSDIHLDGIPTAHSAAETQSVREKAIRVLEINRLADLARVDNSAQAQQARQQLENVIPRIKDSNLKNYAKNKLAEISNKK